MGLWEPDAAAALRLRADLRPARPQAPVQHQCRIRRRRSATAASPQRAQQCGVLVAGRRRSWSPAADDRRGGRRVGQLREAKAACPDTPVFANTGVTIDSVAEHPGDRRRLRGRHPFQGRRQHLQPRSSATASGASWTRCEACADHGSPARARHRHHLDGRHRDRQRRRHARGGEPAGDALHAAVELGGRGSSRMVGQCRRDQPRAGAGLGPGARRDRRHRGDRHAAGHRAPRR